MFNVMLYPIKSFISMVLVSFKRNLAIVFGHLPKLRTKESRLLMSLIYAEPIRIGQFPLLSLTDNNKRTNKYLLLNELQKHSYYVSLKSIIWRPDMGKLFLPNCHAHRNECVCFVKGSSTIFRIPTDIFCVIIIVC